VRVVFTEQSLQVLEEAIYFLEEVERIPKYKVLDIKRELINKAKSLSRHPFKGQKEVLLDHLNTDYRRIIVGNFKIIYKVDSDVVYVLDFFDVHRNPDNMKV
jgi:mRNA-degrading endonuclease RelE of RelBE toxin-antitoxin system